MDKKLIGVIGGVSALALLSGSAVAAPSPSEDAGLKPARSFSELLDPIPNATTVLRIEDEKAMSGAQAEEGLTQVAQYHHHHHHHHHHRYRAWPPRPTWMMRRVGRPHHHHHHHHHHHRYWRG